MQIIKAAVIASCFVLLQSLSGIEQENTVDLQ